MPFSVNDIYWVTTAGIVHSFLYISLWLINKIKEVGTISTTLPVREYIHNLSQFLAQNFLNCCNFLSNNNARSIFCSIKWLWVDSWLRAGHQKDQAMIRSLKFLVPYSREGGMVGHEVNNSSCLHEKASKKTHNSRGPRELPSWWIHPHTRSVIYPNSTETETPALGTPQTSLYISIHLAIHLYHLSQHLINW